MGCFGEVLWGDAGMFVEVDGLLGNFKGVFEELISVLGGYWDVLEG